MLHHDDEYVQLKGKQSTGLVRTVSKLETPSYLPMPYSNTPPKPQHPETPPTSRHHHICQKDRLAAGARRKKAKKEKRGERTEVYVFLYIPDPKTSQHGGDTTLAGLCACLRKKVKALKRASFQAYKKSRYPGATRVCYEQLGLGPGAGGSQMPMSWG